MIPTSRFSSNAVALTHARSFIMFLIATALLVSEARAQTGFVAPIERSGFRHVTSYDSLQAFLRDVGTSPFVSIEPLTKSRSGRSLMVGTVSSSKHFGDDPRKLRVLLFGQQHGDEHTGKEALSMLLARAAEGDLAMLLDKIDLLIVPQMNPDGAELNQRRTVDSIDLNRNHLILTSPEPRALHDLYYRWLPQVTLDVHEYGTLSKSWSDSGFIRIADTQLGMLTNGNTSPEVKKLQHENFYPYIAGYMEGSGYNFQEYIVGSPSDRVRHSTTEINDGRQSFGILGSVSFIQEGIKWKTNEDSLRRRVMSQFTSIMALVSYCAEHSEMIMNVVAQERARLMHLSGEPVAMKMDHFSGPRELRIPVRMIASRRDTTWWVKPYHSEVRIQQSVRMPAEYVIEKKDSAIVQLLRRHHVKVDEVVGPREIRATAYMIDSTVQREVEEEVQPFVSVTGRLTVKTLEPGDFTVSTMQLQSILIASILEPESMWGLTKYAQFGYLLAGKQFPILRIP